jgi:hypothetical protein
MVKQRKDLVYIGIACVPVLVHFFLLDHFLINFANWGDDFIYLEYVKSLPNQNWTERFFATTQFHSEIHRFPLSRIISVSYSYLIGSFNFKQLTMLANLQIALLLLPIYGYVKRINASLLHLIPISLLLFAWNANLDNYSLIGALTHAGSLFFLVSIAYMISSDTWRNWGIWLSLLYPCVATEGFVFLILVGALLIWQRDKRWIPFCFLGGFVAWMYFANYQTTQHSSLHLLERLLGVITHVISYLGGSIKHEPILSMGIGSIFTLLIFIKSRLFFLGRAKSSLFPLLLCGQLIATAAMISWGRSTSTDFNAMFAERFNLYGGMVLVSLYILYMEKIKKNLGLIMVCCWYAVSAWVAYPKLREINKRMIFDMHQARQHKSGNAYPYTAQYDHLLHESGWYHFPSNLD